MLFSQFKANRLAELHNEQWGDVRIPDLMEVYAVARPLRVFEVGSYRGVSTEFWALHCADVVSVDPSPDMAVRRDLHARMAHYPHVCLIQGRSPFVPLKFDYDLVYLDGDHSSSMVRAELKAYVPLLRAGQWIGGHDYTDTPSSGDGVKHAVDEFFQRVPRNFSDGSWLVKIGEAQ